MNLFGIFYQIRDDLLNLDNIEVRVLWLYNHDILPMISQYERNKGFAEDLTEGKFSFPIIHGIHAQPETSLLKGNAAFQVSLCFSLILFKASYNNGHQRPL